MTKDLKKSKKKIRENEKREKRSRLNINRIKLNILNKQFCQSKSIKQIKY